MDPAFDFSFEMSYCGPPPAMADVWSRWNFEPVLVSALLIIAVVGYYALRSVADNRKLAFFGAWAAAIILFISPICALSVALFWVRVSHHVALLMIIAPLAAFALPAAWFRRLPQLLALALSTLLLWFWHVPNVYAATFLHPAMYWGMQISLFVSFTWLWGGLLHNFATAPAVTTGILSAAQMGLLGALLVFAPAPLYLPHIGSTYSFGLMPLEDQQLAGLIMWVPANLPLLAVVLWRLVRSLSPHQAVSA